MAAGGIRSLISGKSDFELVTEGSQFSYFLQEFKARPKFQCQMLPFPFEGTCHYGDTYTQTLPTAGDLLTRIYLKVTLPNISPSVYATSIGNYLFEYAELMINRQVIERYYGEFNQLVQEITVPQIKQPLLSKLSGKDVPNLTGPNTLYIEIPFSLCERGIPMLAVAPGSFEIRIKYRSSREFTFPSVDITDFINGEFLMEYVYLGPDEAKYFEAKKKTYLVQQTQLYQGTVDVGQTTVSYPLHFIGPVKELFFVITNQTVTKNVFDFKKYNLVTADTTQKSQTIPLFYGNGTLISGLYYSNNMGQSWNKCNSSILAQDGAYGNGIFVWVSSITSGFSEYSIDNGKTRIQGYIQNNLWTGVCYGNGVFVAVSSDGYSAYSSDGKTWVRRPFPVVNFSKITYGNGVFVTISQSGIFTYSVDNGQNWINAEPNPIPDDNNWSCICYGNGVFVAASYTGNSVYSTDNGKNWINPQTIPNHIWSSICFGNGVFIAVCYNGIAVYSTDNGQTWIDPQTITNLSWCGICFGDGVFIVTSQDGYTLYSLDNGKTWGDLVYSGTDHLINLQLMLDGYEVIAQDIAVPLYLRGVQPMDFHTRIPTSTIFYMYSFCLDPENIEPTGQLNFGRIQQQILNMNVVQSEQPRYVRVYARSYNIFTTEKGIGKLLFNSNG